VRAKPRGEALRALGYTTDKFSRAAEWRKSSLVRISLAIIMTQSPLRRSYNFHKVPLTAAPQLVELPSILLIAYEKPFKRC